MPPFIKIIAPSAYNWSAETGEKQATLIKVSSRGLIGDDLHSLIKRASNDLVSQLRHMSRDPGEELVHLIALGATEHYGPNRNGDGFDQDDCRAYHSTFPKLARWYRHHQNKDVHKSYGTVKASAFNEAMKRIELIVSLNGTEKLARLREALVADEEMQALSRGDDIPVSMACKVAYDVCSGCGNRARNRAEYCTAATCKYGGLRRNIGKIAADGHHLHARNPRPAFFDISKVGRGADPTAWTLGPIKEAASCDRLPSGAELAEAYNNPYSPSVFTFGMKFAAIKQAGFLPRLAMLERTLPHTDSIASRAFDPRLSKAAVQRGSRVIGLEGHLSALADAGVLLTPEAFFTLASRDGVMGPVAASKVAESKRHLSGVFGDLEASPDLEDVLAVNPYRIGDLSAIAAADLREWAGAKRADYGVDDLSVRARGTRATLAFADAPASRQEKKALDAGQASELARHYALYQLGYLERKGDEGGQLAETVVRMNRVC